MVLAIFFKEDTIHADPLIKPKFLDSYFELQELLAAKGIEPVIVTGQDTYKGEGVFESHWRRGSSKELSNYTKHGSVRADMVFDRGRFVSDGRVTVFNPARIQDICGDKGETLKLFPDYLAQSEIIESEQDLTASQLFAQEKEVIIKAFTGNGGHQVHRLPASKLTLDPPPLHYPFLMQQVIDTSAGAPGLIDKAHDIRVTVLNGEMVAFIVRPRDTWWSGTNDRLKVSSWMLPVSDVPVPLREIVQNIDTVLGDIPRFYSADFMWGNNRWYLIELNSTPGLIPYNRGERAVELTEKLTDFIVSMMPRSS